MMTLPAYVVRDTFKPTALALGILLGLVWLLQSLRFLDLVINKGLGIGVFLNLTLMLIPKLLTVLLPFSVLIGTIAMLRRWQEDNELTATLSVGQGPMRLLNPLLGWTCATIVFGYILFLHLLPASTTAFKDLQYQIRTQSGQLLLEEGTFNQIGKNMMIYLRSRSSPTTLDQILVHDTRIPTQPITWYAQKGEITLDQDGFPQLTLQHGLRQEVGPKQVGMLEFDRYNLDIRQSLGQQMLKERAPEMEEFSLSQLANAAKTEPNKSRAAEMLSELHKRLLWPLTPLPLVLLAAAWLLRPPRRHQSPWRLTVVAALSGFVYLGVMMALNGLAENGSTGVLYGQWALPLVGMAAAAIIAKWGQKRG